MESSTDTSSGANNTFEIKMKPLLSPVEGEEDNEISSNLDTSDSRSSDESDSPPPQKKYKKFQSKVRNDCLCNWINL